MPSAGRDRTLKREAIRSLNRVDARASLGRRPEPGRSGQSGRQGWSRASVEARTHGGRCETAAWSARVSAHEDSQPPRRSRKSEREGPTPRAGVRVSRGPCARRQKIPESTAERERRDVQVVQGGRRDVGSREAEMGETSIGHAGPAIAVAGRAWRGQDDSSRRVVRSRLSGAAAGRTTMCTTHFRLTCGVDVLAHCQLLHRRD